MDKVTNIEERNIISRLQHGDPSALSPIIALYRDKAQGWAMRIVRDRHLAEDVVQEAFLRLPGKIGSLQEPAKFGAWFRQMVRRLAINHIRGFARSIVPIGEIVEPGGGNLMGEDPPGTAVDPLHQWEQQEMEHELRHGTLARLSEQARALMSSFAFEEASPEELAVRFAMNKSNVYNVLSRSRAKANDERFRREADRHIQERRRRALPAARRLEVPRYSRPYALISILIQEVLRLAGEPEWSLTELMALSGDAFRLSVPENCDWRGISTFDWSYAAYRTMERLGLGGDCFGRPSRTTVSPEQQVRLLSMIQETIDQGLPAIVWNLDRNEFGFAYGYDDSARTLAYQGMQSKSARAVSYDGLGRTGQEPPLFVLAIRKRVSAPISEDAVLASIIQHVQGKEPPVAGFAFGLQGYRLWLDAVQSGRLDAHGHAYQVAILAEARQHAALYLERLSEQQARSPERRTALADAAACYRRVSEAFVRLYPSFPYGFGGSHADRFTVIRDGLTEAMEAETEAVRCLEKIFSQG